MELTEHPTECLEGCVGTLIALRAEFQELRDSIISKTAELQGLRKELGFPVCRVEAAYGDAQIGLFALEATASDTATELLKELGRREAAE